MRACDVEGLNLSESWRFMMVVVMSVIYLCS